MAILYKNRTKLHLEAIKKMFPVPSILDIGSGIVPQKYVASKMHICAEPYFEYAKILSGKKDILVLQMDWQGVINRFPENSIGSIILVDVIEHLEKEIVINLLNKTLKIAKFQVIIFTPYGFMPQFHSENKDAWGLSGGEWQNHRSGWKPEDFKEERWTFIISKDFHTHNNFGKKFRKPYGTFWAIYTKKINLN